MKTLITFLSTVFVVLGFSGSIFAQCTIQGPATLVSGQTATYCSSCTAQAYFWSVPNSNLTINGSNTGNCVSVTANTNSGANLNLTLFSNGQCIPVGVGIGGNCQIEMTALATPGCWTNNIPRWKVFLQGVNDCTISNVDEICWQSSDATFGNANQTPVSNVCNGSFQMFFQPINNPPGSSIYNSTIYATISFTDGSPDQNVSISVQMPGCNNGYSIHREAQEGAAELSETLSVYPNPSKDKVNIEFTVEEGMENLSMEVFDIASGKSQGIQVLQSVNKGANNMQYKIPTALKGKTCLVVLKSDGKVIGTKKFVALAE